MQSDVPTIFQESAEPGVINRDMLISLVIEQGPKGEAGRLFLEDSIKFEDIQEIRIEFLNILNIDYIWVMHNLVKLKLSNNIIEKIENLDVLVHLRELDLSFNHIRVMENLNHMTRLEILLLYENKVSVIQGIDDLHQLMIFSIGNNKIDDWDHVMYLRKLKKLRSLNVDGNPCLEKDGYFDYLYAFVPQLIYCRYKMITDKERQLALEQHHRTISNLEEDEAKEKEEEDARRAFEKHIDLLSESYVEYLDGSYLFEQMFKHDAEGRNLTTITEDSLVAYEEYKKTFSAICQELYELGLKEEARRRSEIRQFEDVVNGGKQKVQEEARKTMDEVMKRKSEIFLDVKMLIESMTGELETDALEEKVEQAQRLSEDFNDFISRMWTKLIYKEVVLHEQLDDINEVFKINMTDMVESFLEAAQGYFAQLRNADAEYNENINSIATIYINTFGTNDENKMPSHMLEICGDKDLLTNNLAASRDVHLQIIDSREDRMVDRLKNWLEKHVEKLIEEESKRHRSAVLEISHFLEFQREEFDALQLQRHLSIGSGDPDVIAALEG